MAENLENMGEKDIQGCQHFLPPRSLSALALGPDMATMAENFRYKVQIEQGPKQRGKAEKG